VNSIFPQRIPASVLFGITAVSMSMLAFEISLVRLLSIMLSYHYVYGVTSLALLGSGVGAFVVQYRERKTNQNDLVLLYRRLAFRLTLAAAAMILTVLVIIQISKGSAGNIILYGLLLCIPFYFQGMFLSTLFRVFPQISGKLYFADLTGAALGCVLVVLALNTFNDVESVLLFSVIVAISAIIVALRCQTGTKSLAFSSIGLGLLALIYAMSIAFPAMIQIPIGTNIEKEIYDSLNRFDGEIVETRWSAFGRTDLVSYDKIPEHMDIYLDGTAGTPMYAFNGDMADPDPGVASLRSFPGYFPFQFFDDQQKNTALIIGPGGGRDVLIAMLGGVNQITGVEVNPDLVDLVRDQADYNGGLYTRQEQVSLIVDEGRSFLRSHDTGKFDTILLTLPRTNTSRSREGYALTENYLFTTDSIKEYMDRLTENGHLVVAANDDAEILRLLSLTLTIFEESGKNAEAAMESLYIMGADPNPVFVLRNNAFTEKEMESIHAAAAVWEGYNPQTSFFPHLKGMDKPMSPILYGLAHGQITLNELIKNVGDMGYDIGPVSDNDPFFYKLDAGLPGSIRTVLVLSVLLLLAVSLALFTIDRTEGKQKPVVSLTERLRYLVIFAMLGIGYMVVEISMVQKFVFFLGKPVLSLTVILFAVLLGTGVGSMVTTRVKEADTGKIIFTAALAVVLLLLAYNFIIIPLLFRYLLSMTLFGRTFVSILILLPLSIVMGMPFPLTVRRLGTSGNGSLIPWMWGINAASSVVGSVSAMAVAILFGFNEAVLVGGGCYLIAAAASRHMSLKNRPSGGKS
jgi:hypothetical protein